MTTSIDNSTLSLAMGNQALAIQLEVATLKIQQDVMEQQAVGALKLIEAVAVPAVPEGSLGYHLNMWA